MLKRNIRIEEIDNGYTISTYKQKKGDFYAGESNEAVASSAGDVKEVLSSWLGGDDKPTKVLTKDDKK